MKFWLSMHEVVARVAAPPRATLTIWVGFEEEAHMHLLKTTRTSHMS